MEITVYFKRLNSSCLSILIYSKRTADGELERRMLLEEGLSTAVGGNRIQKRGVVGEVRPVRDDGGLQIGPHQHGVISPVDPEGRIYHGQQNLHLHTGGHARRLRSRRNHSAFIEAGLRESI